MSTNLEQDIDDHYRCYNHQEQWGGVADDHQDNHQARDVLKHQPQQSSDLQVQYVYIASESAARNERQLRIR